MEKDGQGQWGGAGERQRVKSKYSTLEVVGASDQVLEQRERWWLGMSQV